MRKIEDLDLGFSDAQNYCARESKEMFNEIFVKNSFLQDLLKPTKYFLVGEKGTGKTAYATFLSNGEYINNRSILKFISSTDYEKFYTLKNLKHIYLADYCEIWKVIIMLILSKSVTENDKAISIFNRCNLDQLNQAIDEYYLNAFSPEIITALKFIDRSELAARIISKYVEAGGTAESKQEFTEERFQMNLFYINKKFSDCLASLKLSKNVTLYIDGIDIRPSVIPFSDYIDCIRGLSNACWSLNNDLFRNVRDSKGRFKVVLLLRPDIFNSLEMQNATNKLVDNSVYLDWNTTYVEYRNSPLYAMAEKLLNYNQSEMITDCWGKYFSWKLPTTSQTRRYDTAFMEFLRISLSRPRDIQRILSILHEKMKNNGRGKYEFFDVVTYRSDAYQNAYSEYFLSSLKDQLSFYYSESDYKHFRKFFEFFENSDFTYNEYLVKYNKFIEYILNNAQEIPQFVETPKDFMQFLYDCNVIATIENKNNGGQFFHFSYREKSPTNICPEVIYNENATYKFHYGLYKKAKFGRF